MCFYFHLIIQAFGLSGLQHTHDQPLPDHALETGTLEYYMIKPQALPNYVPPCAEQPTVDASESVGIVKRGTLENRIVKPQALRDYAPACPEQITVDVSEPVGIVKRGTLENRIVKPQALRDYASACPQEHAIDAFIVDQGDPRYEVSHIIPKHAVLLPRILTWTEEGVGLYIKHHPSRERIDTAALIVAAKLGFSAFCCLVLCVMDKHTCKVYLKLRPDELRSSLMSQFHRLDPAIVHVFAGLVCLSGMRQAPSQISELLLECASIFCGLFYPCEPGLRVVHTEGTTYLDLLAFLEGQCSMRLGPAVCDLEGVLLLGFVSQLLPAIVTQGLTECGMMHSP